jgi:hypothetical protein
MAVTDPWYVRRTRAGRPAAHLLCGLPVACGLGGRPEAQDGYSSVTSS